MQYMLYNRHTYTLVKLFNTFVQICLARYNVLFLMFHPLKYRPILFDFSSLMSRLRLECFHTMQDMLIPLQAYSGLIMNCKNRANNCATKSHLIKLRQTPRVIARGVCLCLIRC